MMNLYDQCMFNGQATDSTFTTYMEMKKVTISNGVIRIAAITKTKYTHTILDYSKILDKSRDKLKEYLN